MVAEVHDIVRREKPKRDRRDLLDRARHVPQFLGDPTDDVCQVTVVRVPEAQEIGPRAILAVLALHPVVLRVWRERQRALLRAHESLMVVGGRVDQVADHLLGGPLVRCQLSRSFGFRDPPQLRERGLQILQQVCRDSGERR